MNVDKINHIGKCKKCHAVTIFANSGNKSKDFSMSEETMQKHFGTIDTSNAQQYDSCNHCDNDWGVDLCKCQSGELANECKEGTDVCGETYQSMPELTNLLK